MKDKLVKIAQKFGIDPLELFVIMLAQKVSGGNVKSVVSSLNISYDEELEDLFREIENFDVDEIMELIENYDKAAQILALFFTPFISAEAIFSQNSQLIRKDLEKYPEEIKEAIIKTLEMLSAVSFLQESEKRAIIKESLNIIKALSKIFMLLGE